MGLLFIKPPEPISAHGLHDPDQHIGIIGFPEFRCINRRVVGQAGDVVFQQLFPYCRWNIGLRVVQQRSHIILQGPLPAPLVIYKAGLPVTQHNVTRLEIAIKKVVRVLGKKVIDQGAVVILQKLLIKGDSSKLEEVVFEIAEVPLHTLLIETGTWITC